MNIERLQNAFGKRLKINLPIARYTSARLGGVADAMLEVSTKDELARAAEILWSEGLDWIILGGGSNVLVSDAGFRGVVVLNRARRVRIQEKSPIPTVWAESGANLGRVARQVALKGLSGLEWAAGIPGTIGGAVVGNAGAHGGDIAGNLVVAEILQRSEKVQEGMPDWEGWQVERLQYAYRTSLLKRHPGQAVVLAARLKLEHGTPEAILAKMEELTSYRHRTQPPGASMGSMFKNPPGDFAGRLIEAAGLKGYRIGDAQISTLHGNFFVNLGKARAVEVYELIQVARHAVVEKFGLHLQLEIELVGDWKDKGEQFE